jgi:PhnB protein
VTQPVRKEFWGALFGQLTDKFGIQWMIMSEAPPQP